MPFNPKIISCITSEQLLKCSATQKQKTEPTHSSRCLLCSLWGVSLPSLKKHFPLVNCMLQFHLLYIKQGDVLSPPTWIILSPKRNPKLNSALVEIEDQRQVEIYSPVLSSVLVWGHLSLKRIFHILCWMCSDTKNPSARKEASMPGTA